jgi:hypothetical protein
MRRSNSEMSNSSPARPVPDHHVWPSSRNVAIAIVIAKRQRGAGCPRPPRLPLGTQETATPRSRLSLPSFLSAPRIPRFPSFRLPMLAPLLASALVAISAYGGAAPSPATSTTSVDESAQPAGLDHAQPS